MRIDQRALLGGLIVLLAAAAVVMLLGVAVVYVALALAVLLLVALVVVNRERTRAEAELEDEWSEAGDWGLGVLREDREDEEPEDDEVIDLDDRLSGLGLGAPSSDTGLPVREPDTPAGDGSDALFVEDLPPAAEDEVVEYEVVEYEEPSAPEGDVLEEYEYEFEYVDEGELGQVEEPGGAASAVPAVDALDAEEVLADEGRIDEGKVDSDEAILAAANATAAVNYNRVLEREEANTETREILSRVATLLEKYE